MIGTNQKSYSWLVKGGEDLRQDQRVEELWLLMNDVLRRNALTNARGLQLETYQVVPMSMQLGLVEWVEGTAPVKSLLEDQLKLEHAEKPNRAKSLAELGAYKVPKKKIGFVVVSVLFCYYYFFLFYLIIGAYLLA